MTPFVNGFARELVKLGTSAHHGESGLDVVMAESMGPIPSMVKGFRHGGALQALKSGAGYVGGGGAGAGAGWLLAKGLERLLGGRDPGWGSLRVSTVLPAIGGVLGGLRGARLAGD